jgi:hypothetical protein
MTSRHSSRLASFRGIRPRIDAIASTTLPQGGSFTMSVSRTEGLTAVVLVGTGAVTHWVDGGLPLIVPLSFTQQASSVTASIPADFNVAPVGFYMLFAMVDDIPSDGVVVQLTDSLTVSVPPQPGSPAMAGTVRPNPFSNGFGSPGISRVRARPRSESSTSAAGPCSSIPRIERPVGTSSSGMDSIVGRPAAPRVFLLRVDVGGLDWRSRLVHLGH